MNVIDPPWVSSPSHVPVWTGVEHGWCYDSICVKKSEAPSRHLTLLEVSCARMGRPGRCDSMWTPYIAQGDWRPSVWKPEAAPRHLTLLELTQVIMCPHGCRPGRCDSMWTLHCPRRLETVWAIFSLICALFSPICSIFSLNFPKKENAMTEESVQSFHFFFFCEKMKRRECHWKWNNNSKKKRHSSLQSPIFTSPVTHTRQQRQQAHNFHHRHLQSVEKSNNLYFFPPPLWKKIK